MRNKIAEKKEALRLFKLGYTRVYIAKKLNVTQKTVGKWVKVHQEEKESLQKQIDELKKEVETLKKKMK